jgi:hypothetical protein
VGKYCRAEQAIGDNMACALHAGYLSLHTHTLRICNTALQLQQWLQEYASVLHYMYITCLAKPFIQRDCL